MTNVIELTDKNFEKEVVGSNEPVLVDFWAPWCQPCLMMGPILDSLSNELKGKVKIAKLNVDEAQNKALAAKYQIMSIPNMKLFKNGEITKEFVGLRQKEMLKKELENEI
jgi:thioredoxin 1